MKWTFRRSRGRLDGPRLATEDPLSPESQQFKLSWLRRKRNCASISKDCFKAASRGEVFDPADLLSLDRRLAAL
jgi:hypothetical protein